MSNKYPIAGLDLPHTPTASKLKRILSAALPSEVPKDQQIGEISPYWDATYFNLHQVKIFQEATESEQQAILEIASRSLLEEAYFVEKAGMGYMAKMILLAETTEERMLYSLFAANEATHLSHISAFFSESEKPCDNPFLVFLRDLIETEDKTTLLFVIQVVLEGWGLSHYRSLYRHCRDRTLAQLFQGFLADEARHHSTGIISFNQCFVADASEKLMIEVLSLFLGMIQVGPQRVLGAIAQVKGDLSRQQKVRILEELNTETHSGTRLNLMRYLMRSEKAERIIQALEARGAFKPLSAEECV